MSDSKKPVSLATIAAHAGTPTGRNAPVTTPIVQSTTFRFENAQALIDYNERGTTSGLYLYSRDENPTVRAAEQAVAQLEGGESALLFASGMGAMSCALMTFASGGEEILCSSTLYGGTYRFLRDVLGRFGVTVRPVAPERLADACGRPGKARLCVFESPTNPHLRVLDVAAIAAACKASGVTSVIDSTFGTPALQRPLALGVDVVMHSTTKFLNGHSDHLGGALVGSKERIAQLWHVAVQLGASLDPQVAYDLLRGLKTFPLRMQRQSESAFAVARFLAGRPAARRVFYPGLPSHPDHALAARQMSAFGAMVTFSLGEKDAAFRFYDRLRLIARAASLGGVESLCSLPILTSHTGYSKEELAQAGVDEGMVRLSIGLEQVDDILEDLGQALPH